MRPWAGSNARNRTNSSTHSAVSSVDPLGHSLEASNTMACIECYSCGARIDDRGTECGLLKKARLLGLEKPDERSARPGIPYDARHDATTQDLTTKANTLFLCSFSVFANL